MQRRGVPGIPGDLFVPRQQHFGRTPPQVNQAPGGDLHLQRREEDLPRLVDGQPQAVVKDRRHRHQPVADRRPRQGGADLRLDVLLAAGTPVTRNDVLDGLDGEIDRQILDDAFAETPRRRHGILAMRAMLQLPDVLASIDASGRWATMTFVARLRPDLAPTTLRCRGPGVGRDGPEGVCGPCAEAPTSSAMRLLAASITAQVASGPIALAIAASSSVNSPRRAMPMIC